MYPTVFELWMTGMQVLASSSRIFFTSKRVSNVWCLTSKVDDLLLYRDALGNGGKLERHRKFIRDSLEKWSEQAPSEFWNGGFIPHLGMCHLCENIWPKLWQEWWIFLSEYSSFHPNVNGIVENIEKFTNPREYLWKEEYLGRVFAVAKHLVRELVLVYRPSICISVWWQPSNYLQRPTYDHVSLTVTIIAICYLLFGISKHGLVIMIYSGFYLFTCSWLERKMKLSILHRCLTLVSMKYISRRTCWNADIEIDVPEPGGPCRT